MAKTQILIYHGFEYRLIYTKRYGFGLQSRPHSKYNDSWTDVELMATGEVEEVMKRILGISTE